MDQYVGASNGYVAGTVKVLHGSSKGEGYRKITGQVKKKTRFRIARTVG